MPKLPGRATRALPAAAALVSASLAVAAPAGGLQRTVHLGGTAYEFNRTSHRLGGATIRVAEQSCSPSISAKPSHRCIAECPVGTSDN